MNSSRLILRSLKGPALSCLISLIVNRTAAMTKQALLMWTSYDDDALSKGLDLLLADGLAVAIPNGRPPVYRVAPAALDLPLWGDIAANSLNLQMPLFDSGEKPESLYIVGGGR